MKPRKISLALLILFAFVHICSGQSPEETQPTENWLWKDYKIFPDSRLYHLYERYSKEDIVKFREKLDLLKNAQFADEWEGIYTVGYEETVGFSQFRWRNDVGFLSFHIYTCLPELRSINYGKIINTPDFIQLSPEYAENSPRRHAAAKYIKVKWGEHRFLVEESALPAFAEKAVGIFVNPDDPENENYHKWINHWVQGDFEKPYAGLPEFPEKYKKFQRLPIEAKIIAVGKRAVEENAASYTVTINAGRNKGVKKGLHFDVPEIEQNLEITQVNDATAVGIIARSIDENENDQCFGDDFNKIICPKIKSGLKVKTQIGSFNW
ncbi:MAG TPA: hypothetical protein VK400_07685 [Pyrinomonadaceae bacterium]|nr:hypothetical protein [Pyrinomonadaceae bacterium]